MATSSLEKTFSVDTKESATRIANQIIASENGNLPKESQKCTTEVLTLEKILDYAKQNGHCKQ